MRRLLFTLLMLPGFFAFSQPTVLQPGDIVIIGFNFKDPDEFSFISFVDLNPGTTIYFTDCGWKLENTFREREGVITYTVPAAAKKSKMEVITYPHDPGFTTAGVSGFFGFNVDGDQLFVYQGSFENPTFLFGLDSSEHPWLGEAEDNNSSALPPALASSGMHVQFTKVINGMYDCLIATSPNPVDLIQSVLNVSNWNTSPNRFSLPSSCFNNTLPITLVDFTIHESTKGHYSSFELFTDEETVVFLEESEDGEQFAAIDSVLAINGHKLYTFSSLLNKNYYRLFLKSRREAFYSNIISLNSKDKMVREWIVYTIQGNVLLYSTEGNRMAKNAITNSGVYLLKKIYEDGSFEVEKLIIE